MTVQELISILADYPDNTQIMFQINKKTAVSIKNAEFLPTFEVIVLSRKQKEENDSSRID